MQNLVLESATREMPYTCCGHWRLDAVVVSQLASADPLIRAVQVLAKHDAHQGPLTFNTLAVLSGGIHILYSTKRILKAVAFRNPKYSAACRND